MEKTTQPKILISVSIHYGMVSLSLRLLCVLLLLALGWGNGKAQTPPTIPLQERVLVVYNTKVPTSLEVANYYLTKRGIPQANLCAISPPDTSNLPWDGFESVIRKPIQTCLNAIGKNRVLYIVFAYQTPFRLLQVPTESGLETRALDQFVADIWNESVPDVTEINIHSYFAASQSQGNFYPPFVSLADYRNQTSAQTLYSVWRLDAATVELAKGMVDKALLAEATRLQGQSCFDRRFGNVANLEDWNYGAGDWDLFRAAEATKTVGVPVNEDDQEAEFGTAPAPLRCDQAALYSGWYSYNNYTDAFTWATGAIGFHLDSGSALDPRGGANWSANALQRGLTVTSGAINEPYLEGLPHADGVIRNLFAGANVGDAFLRNTAFLQWMVINLGDPLYLPFPNGLPPFNVPSFKQDSLAFDQQFIVGGNTVTATLTLAAPAPTSGTEVTLTNSRLGAVTIPDKLIIPAGESKAVFSIKSETTTYYQAPVITASYNGKALSNTLTLAPLLASISFDRPMVAAGRPVQGTIRLNDAAPSGGVRILLSSDTPSVVLSDSVLIPAGQTKTAFSLSPAAVQGTVTVFITASLNGGTESASFTVVPARQRIVVSRGIK